MLSLDKLRLSSYVKLATSPLPRPKHVHEARTRIMDRFYLDGLQDFSPEKRLALWNRLNTQKEKAIIENQELACAVGLVFLGLDRNHPALSEHLPLVEKVLQQVVDYKDPRTCAILVKQYFSAYPLKVAKEEPLRLLINRATSLSEWTAGLLPWYFFSASPFEQVIEKIPLQSGFTDAFNRQCNEIISTRSHFAMYAFARYVSRYSSMVAKVIGKPEGLRAVLELIKQDIDGQRGSQLWMQTVPALAKAVWKPMDIGTGCLPTQEEQILLSRFFNDLFGVTDKNDQSVWEKEYDYWKRLLKYWKFGLNLNALFDCATEFIEGNHRSSWSEQEVAIRHWVARRKFWVAYWAAGRLHNVRLLFPSNSSSMRRNALQRKYALRPTPGIKVGMPATAVGFLAQIDELYISEQSSNGSFRVYLNKPSWFHDSEVQTSEVNADSDREFRHHTGWQADVNWYIATQTGKPTPTNVR